MRKTLACLGLCAIAALATACPPAPDGSGGTTTTAAPTTTTIPGPTTTVAPGMPAPRCYDNTVDASSADYTYTGTPDLVGNMTYHNSSDGSCSGALWGPGDSTLVIADDEATADATCVSLGRPGVAGTWISQGWTGLTPNAWVC